MATINLEELSNDYPLLTHELSLEPLWASDTGRNTNSGTYSGTFIGFFSQIKLEFGETSQTQMQLLRNMFDNATVSVRYKDSTLNGWNTETFYTTAISSKLDYWNGKYQPFNITLTGLKKRK